MMGRPPSSTPRHPLPGLRLQPEVQTWLQSGDAAPPLRGLAMPIRCTGLGLPPERHTAGKGWALNWNEGLHSVWRGRLNRLMRRTKGYTESVAMLAYSLAWSAGCGHCKVNPALC